MSYLKSNQISTTKKKKKPANERKKLIAKLDDLVRQVIRLRDTHCSCCKKKLGEDIQVSHFVTRRIHAVRWNLKNVSGSCPGCNLRHNFNPVPYARYMIDTYGKEVLDELFVTKNTVKKLSMSDLRDIEEGLNETLHKMQNQ